MYATVDDHRSLLKLRIKKLSVVLNAMVHRLERTEFELDVRRCVSEVMYELNACVVFTFEQSADIGGYWAKESHLRRVGGENFVP